MANSFKKNGPNEWFAIVCCVDYVCAICCLGVWCMERGWCAVMWMKLMLMTCGWTAVRVNWGVGVSKSTKRRISAVGALYECCVIYCWTIFVCVWLFMDLYKYACTCAVCDGWLEISSCHWTINKANWGAGDTIFPIRLICKLVESFIYRIS